MLLFAMFVLALLTYIDHK
ncbi:putative holin-like toxin [Lactobacillus kalixensis]|nr:putative holin-like toxin [Lactobacillus kalixensis]